MAEIEKDGKGQSNNTGNPSPVMTGVYKTSVELPSRSYRTYGGGTFLQMSVPGNWKEMSDNDGVFFTPEGAYGKDGITHGVLIGLYSASSRDLAAANNEYVNGLLQGNKYLSKQGNSSGTYMAGRAAMATRLYGTSPVTNRTEIVTIHTVTVSDGRLFFFAAVSPQNEAATYDRAFSTMRGSLRISDR
jgi:hypothetical protein